jgi:putative endopeptidase
MKKIFRTSHLISLAVAFILLGLACSGGQHAEPPLNPANMDITISPGEDFFQYANGGWIANNPIPDEYSRYGSFEKLTEENYAKLKTLFNQVAGSDADKGSIEQKIRDFYNTGMDSAKIEKEGIAPLKADLEKIDNLQNTKEVQNHLAYMHSHGIYPGFYIFAYADEKNSDMVIAQLMQGGLGLPDRDYYTSDDGRSKELRKAYTDHLKKMFSLLGDSRDAAERNAATVMAMETRLAIASMTRLDRRDPHKTYHKMNVKKLQKTTPLFNWQLYFDGIGLTDPGDLNVRQPQFFTEFSDMMNDVELDDWKTYLRWHLINSTASCLSPDFVEQDFEFYGKMLSGKKALQPRWKRVMNATSSALGEAVGQLYVKKYFPPAAKKRMLDLVENLKVSLEERIETLDWMGGETQKAALSKLETMNVKIGYPDKWIDYSPLEIKADSYILNVMRADNFNFQRDMAKVNKPVDPDEWHMNPQTVNAYYSPTSNEIVFPAAILQPPFFNMKADDAVNYGAIGVVIGHEMTHGFDDQGRQYDVDGNLRDWWTEEDAKRFDQRTQVLVDQYNRFSVFDTLHVDGKLTLGENIADLGGLNISYQALQKALKENPQPKTIDGFTPAQRFFLAYAQVWRQSIRPEELQRRLKEDVHSPGRFRTNGPIANMPEFHAAFDVKSGEALYKPENERAVIW